MNYDINITKGYPALLNLDNSSELCTYFSIEHGSSYEKVVLSVENLEINADRDLWCNQAIAENPSGVIAQFQDIYDDELSIASFLLRKAKIVIEGDVTYCMCISNNKEEIYHSPPVSFSKGSKYIYAYAKSSEYKNSNIGIYIFFSGALRILFEDSDVLLQMVEFKNCFSTEDVKVINSSQDILNGLRCKDIDRALFNNKKSLFFDFDFLIRYFEHTEDVHTALKDYPG